jgi:type II secretory pathway component GspD/PulD (secretin)
VNWIALVGSIAMTAVPLAPLQAQTAPEAGPAAPADARPQKPRSAFQTGKELYLKGEYEAAEPLLQIANENRKQLSAAEQAQLDDYQKRNAEAVKGRRLAVEQMVKASEAINAGRTQEADSLLKALRSSKYLTAAERQQVAVLAEQAKQKGGRPRGMFAKSEPAPSGLDADALLADARKACDRGDYDQAEMLAREAERAGHHSLFPWSDTPAKVMKDVQAGRSKMMAKMPDGKAASAGDSRKNAAARDLLRQARQAADAGDTVKARKLVKEAEALHAQLPWWEENTVEKVNDAITRAEMAAGKPATTMTAKADATAGGQKPPQPADAKVMVREARQAIAENQLDKADELAKRARLVPGVKWGLFEDTPDKVLADVIKARDASNQDKATAMLSEARRKFEQGHYDEAEKLTYQAETLRTNYPLWYRGDRPDKLRAEIASKRRQAQKPLLPPMSADGVAKKAFEESAKASAGMTAKAGAPKAEAAPTMPRMPSPDAAYADARKVQAQQMLAEARRCLARGDQKGALDLAAQAMSMGVAFNPAEDSPEAVLQAVKALQAQSQMRGNPQMAEAAHMRATQLLATARLMQKEGRLLEALHAVAEAQKCGAVFTPNDELPETVLADLRKNCQQHIDTYSAAAKTLLDQGKTAEAEKYLKYVADLCVGYQVENQAVMQQLAEVRRALGGEAPAVAAAGSEQGQQLYAEAMKELKRGDVIKARKLAEALYSGPFEMKAQAGQLLAQIDDAEYKQEVSRAATKYELGVRAYSRKEYAVAASYLQSIDLKLLDARKRAHAQEILASKDMQPHTLVQTSTEPEAAPGTGKSVASDQAPPPAKADEPKPTGLVDQVRQRQLVELQRLREQKLQSEQQANKLAGQGNLDGAVDVLTAALNSVKASELDPEQTAPLRRQLEERLKRFNTMREQMAFEKLQKDQLAAKTNESRRKFLAEEHKKEQVAELMRQYQTFMKEGKYTEAEAVAMKAHEIDPDNVQADAGVFKAKMLRGVSSEDKIKAAKEGGFAAAMQDVSDSAVAEVDNANPVKYDKTWAMTARRKNKSSLPLQMPSKEDKEVTSKLNTYVSIDFKNKPLSEVLDELRTMTGVNIVPDKAKLDEEAISLEQPVTIKLDGVMLKNALKLILNNARLTYAVRDGVLMVTTPAGRRGDLVKRIYPVADLIVPLESHAAGVGSVAPAAPPPAGNRPRTESPYAQSAGANGTFGTWTVGGPVVGTSGGKDPMASANGKKRGNETMEETLKRLITDTIDPQSWDGVGGSGHIDYYPLGMSLVVSQTIDVQEQVQQLLDRLRELQAVQVTVEVRFILLTEDFYERIGIDFDVDINDKQTRFEPQVVNNSFAPGGFINEPDHLDNVIVGLTPTGNFTQDLDIPINNSSFGLATPPFGGFPNQPGANGGIDIGVAFLSSIEVFLFMEAAQGDARTSILTAPKITLFNGQNAHLESTTTDFFVTDVDIIVDPFFGTVITIPRNTPFPSSTSLDVRAVVSADRRYVTLDLLPIISRVTPFKTFTPVTGGLTITLEQPQTNTLLVSTTVSVPDGGTILMGGLKLMSEGRNEFGPPILSKIPYINRLFRNVGYGKESSSLLIMVTPRIIIPEEEEEKLGQTFAF